MPDRHRGARIGHSGLIVHLLNRLHRRKDALVVRALAVLMTKIGGNRSRLGWTKGNASRLAPIGKSADAK
jgi:hypothetical protein